MTTPRPIRSRAVRPRPVRAGLLCADLGVLVLFVAALARTHTGASPLWDGWVANGTLLLVSALVCAFPLRNPQHRGVWIGTAVGVVAWSAGHAAFWLQVRQGGSVPVPSWGDIGYLAFYPAFYIGISLRRRAAVSGSSLWDSGSWLDGLAAGLAVAAVGAAVVFHPAPLSLSVSGGALTGLARLAGDAVLLATVVGLLATARVHAQTSALLTFGFACFTVADCLALVQSAHGSYRPGTVLDVLWYAGLVAIAHGVWQDRSGVAVAAHVRPRRYQELLPAVSGLTGLGVLLLLPGADWDYLLETALASGALVLALVRLPLALHALSHLSQAYSITHIDPLTGLASRHALHERLHRETTALAAGYDRALLLVSVDLDDFTDVNVVLGHQAGDELLRSVADRLRAAVAALPQDCEHLLARATADEFVLLASGPDVDRPELVKDVVEALHTALRDPFTVGTSRLSVAGHSGSVVARGAADAEQMLRRIEAARSEAQTRDVASVAWNDNLDRTRLVRAEAVLELLTAIEDGQLLLHYQPQTHLASDRAAGMEALVRWQHPTRGLLYPDAFLPLAERAGLQHALTAEVLRIAVGQAAAWWSAGLRLPVSINLSASDLFDKGLRGRILDLLEANDLPVAALHLEITETVAMADPEFAVGVVDALRAEGLEVSLDDFGTGYSSLAYLRQLQVDELKLDRSLIMDLTSDPRALAIVRSTLALAGSLGVRVVAEGVETEREWALLDQEGCHLAQGYWRSRPLDVHAATAWLEQDRREAQESPLAGPARVQRAATDRLEPSAFADAMSGRLVGRLARRAQPLRAGMLTSEVDTLFRQDLTLTSVLLPLFEGGPMTLLSREQLDLAMAGPLGYGRTLHMNRPVERLLRPVPLVLPAEAPLGDGVVALLSREGTARFEDVPVRFADGGWGLMRVPQVLTDLATTFADRIVRDRLTGLPNRTVLAAAVCTTLELESSVAMLFVDLDRFRSVNDTWGHDAGDAVLCEVAERLCRTVRAGAVVARLGGDEFGILLPDVATALEALAVGERIVLALSAPFQLPTGTALISASVGVALLQPGVDPVREAPYETLLTTDELLLDRADQALYGAKTGGRGRVAPFIPGMRRPVATPVRDDALS